MLSYMVFIVFNLIVASQQQSNKLILGFGDSYSAGGGKQAYPLVAGSLLNWPTRNFAVGGSKMADIPSQLAKAGSLVSNVTHIVLTTSGNDLGVGQTLQAVIVHNDAAGVISKIAQLKPRLVATYQFIRSAVRPGTKIFAVPYVDFISVGNQIPNEDKVHQVLKIFADMIKSAAADANIGYIEAVFPAFADHEMYSADPYAPGLNEPGAAHPNLKGYYKIGEIVADYLKSN